MKKVYNVFPTVMLFAALLMMGSCASSLTYQDALSRNERKIEDTEMLNDARFLVEARSFNLLQMRMAEAAIRTGYASSVVELARKYKGEFETLDKELTTLARKEKIALPAMMKEEHQRYLSDLNESDREDFDNSYIQMLSKVNDENQEEYLKMATDAKDEDIRAFSARKLDVFKNHDTGAEEVAKKLLNTY